MGAFEFNKCCFCIDLKTGCFIIAYFSLVIYVILAAIGIAGLAIGGTIAVDKDSNKEQEDVAISVVVLAALLLLFTIVLLTFIIILLVGLHKNKPGHVKAYLIYASVFVGISVILFISNAASGHFDAKSLFQNIFSILLSIYFILVIRSQYLVMKNPQRGPAIYNAA